MVMLKPYLSYMKKKWVSKWTNFGSSTMSKDKSEMVRELKKTKFSIKACFMVHRMYGFGEIKLVSEKSYYSNEHLINVHGLIFMILQQQDI